MIITKKMQVRIIGDKEEVDRVYRYIRNGMYAQNSAFNILCSRIYASYLLREPAEKRKEIYKIGARNQGSLKGPSLYDGFDFLEFPVGLSTASTVSHTAKKEMQAQIKNGLLKGRISLRNRKLDAPLLIASGALYRLQSAYKTREEILAASQRQDFTVSIKFVNKIRFEIVFGSPYRSQDLRDAVAKILCGAFTARGASICLEGNKIFFLMSVDIGEKISRDLDEKRSVGCHIGFGAPIVCATNEDSAKEYPVGDTQAFITQREHLQDARRRLQGALKYAKGGHGRKKKLAALRRFEKRERNFARTCNHQFSAAVVKYAVKQNAKYINLEVIEKDELDRYTLRNWSYYAFQSFVQYKAEKNGITVRFVKLKEEDYALSDGEIARKLAHATGFLSQKEMEQQKVKEEAELSEEAQDFSSEG